MPDYSEGTTTTLRTGDGLVRITMLDRVSPERLLLMLVKGAAAAEYGNLPDNTPVVTSEVKMLVVDPRSEG